MQFRHPPRRRSLSAAPKSCRMPRGRAQGCGSVRLAFSRPTAHPPPVAGAESISARGTLRRRGVRRDEGIPPYGRPGGGGHSGLSKTQNIFVGAGFIPPASPCPAASRADMESAPTKVCYNAGAAVSRSARRHPRFVGEGHGPPADLAATQGPGTMQASSPTEVAAA